MPDVITLASRMEGQLPRGLLDFIRAAGDLAQRRQQRLYLVGGVVRDLLLGRDNLDIDLVVEGDAIKLAEEIASTYRAKVTPHPRFGTARLEWKGGRADLATARAESYAHPGALPTVQPGTINEDLARRDFTVNAMAEELNPRHYGELLDPHGGRRDIAARLVRVLHDRSFTDDATRIWRAIRYEQRLDFQIESATLKLLKRDINMLSTVSGDRVRHELELVLKEESPEKSLRRAGELGVLGKLHPALRGDDWLAETFALARQGQADLSPQLYLSLLAYRLTAPELDSLISYLRLPKASAETLRDTLALKENIKELSTSGLSPSRIYDLLHGHSPTAINALCLASGSPNAAGHCELYSGVLRNVHPSLTGEDLKKMGVPEGPGIKKILLKLREARLDGRVDSKRQEEEMVRGLISGV
ncbi:MAG: CCA tRNA nucleotidyltransferase [Chloroflexota bacterium]